MRKKIIFLIVTIFLILFSICIIPNYSNAADDAIGSIISQMNGANTPSRW